MTRRLLAGLGAITLVALAIAGFALWGQSRPAALPADTGGKLFPDLAAHAGDIAKVEIVSGEGTIVLQKQGEAWVLPAKAGYPANAGRISDLVSTLAGLVLLEPKTADPARYDQLGLADPGKETGAGKLVRLLDATDAPVAAAVFGRSAPSLGRSGGGIYVRRQGEAQTWLAEGLFNIPDTLLAWAAPLAFDAGNVKAVKSIVIADGAGKPLLSFSRAKPEDDTFVVQPALPGKPDMDKIGRLAATPASLGFDDMRRAMNGDMAKPVRVITFEGADGARYRLSLFAIGKDVWAKAEQQAPGAKSLAPVHGDFLYKLQDYRLGLLQANAKDFVAKPAVDPSGAAHMLGAHP